MKQFIILRFVRAVLWFAISYGIASIYLGRIDANSTGDELFWTMMASILTTALVLIFLDKGRKWFVEWLERGPQ